MAFAFGPGSPEAPEAEAPEGPFAFGGPERTEGPEGPRAGIALAAGIPSLAAGIALPGGAVERPEGPEGPRAGGFALAAGQEAGGAFGDGAAGGWPEAPTAGGRCAIGGEAANDDPRRRGRPEGCKAEAPKDNPRRRRVPSWGQMVPNEVLCIT